MAAMSMTLHTRLQSCHIFAKHVTFGSFGLFRAELNGSHSKFWRNNNSHSQSTSLHSCAVHFARTRTNLLSQNWTTIGTALSNNIVPAHSCKFRLTFPEIRNCFQKSLTTHVAAAPYSSKSVPENRDILREDIIAFIDTEEDFQLFLRQLQNVLDINPETSQSSVSNLALLVQKLVALNCEPRNIAAMLLGSQSILKVKSSRLLQTIDFLEELGLNWRRLMKVLDQNPAVWTASLQQLQARVAYLRKLGFVEGSLQKAIADWAEILTISTNRMKAVVQVLMEKCGFSKADTVTILGDSPEVLAEDLESIEVKFQYVFFRMGITENSEMTQAKIYKYSLNHLRCRHLALERLGLYAAPDNRGRFSIQNPKLSKIVDSSDNRFAEKVANISMKELDAFAKTVLEEVRLQKLGGAAFQVTDLNQFRDEDSEYDSSTSEDEFTDGEFAFETEEPFDFDRVDYRKKK